MKNELPEMTKDEVGGLHDGIIGYNPQGAYCGECNNITCSGCGYEKVDHDIEPKSKTCNGCIYELAICGYIRKENKEGYLACYKTINKRAK